MSERPRTAGRINHEFTPRQKQVLDLLVQGRTNREIADSLGITLDGAKWHVSEIISRLGVESREDAANYWRHENGLPVRIIRFLRGIVPGAAAGKALAGGAAAGLALGVAAIAITLAGDGDAGSGDRIATDPALVSFAGTQMVTQAVAPGDGIMHRVAEGETVASIVAKYDNVTIEQTLGYRPNALTSASEVLEAGRFVLLPGATFKSPPATPTATSTPTVGPKEREMTALALTPTATPIPVSNGVCPPGIDQDVCDFAMSIANEPAAGWRTLAIRELGFECPTDNSFQFVRLPLCANLEPGASETGYAFGVKMQQFVNEAAFRDLLMNWAPSTSEIVAIGCLRESENGSFDCASDISIVFESPEMGLVALLATRTEDEFPVHAALAGGFVETASGWMLAAYGPMSEPRPDIWLMPWRP